MLSQEELAERAGLAVRTIRYLEAERATPRPASLCLLAEALTLDAADRAADHAGGTGRAGAR